MTKYVKIKGYDNWFLVLSKDTDNSKFIKLTQNKLWTEWVTKGLHGSETATKVERFKNLCTTHQQLYVQAIYDIDYNKAVDKYGTIYINLKGGYMTLSDNIIEEEIYSNYYPIDTQPKYIIVCENNYKPEYDWIQYLQTRYPDKPIYVINHFHLREVEEIKELIKDCKVLTFSTTFSDIQWFINLVKANKEYNKPIVGYCHIKENWKQALEIHPSIEVVKDIKMSYYTIDNSLLIDKVKF